MKRTLMIALIGGIANAWAATYYVATNGNDTWSGTSWGTALATISNGVAKASAGFGGVVLVSNGVYYPAATISIGTNITVQSWHDGYGDQTNTILDGQGATRWGVVMNHSAAVLDGFTITNSGGGGISIGAKGGTVRHCWILNNTRNINHGAGIDADGGAIISNCVVAGNAVTNNPSGYGGGIRVAGYNVRIIDSIVSNNSSSGSGGGIYITGYADVLNCTITTNTATAVAGGGIYIDTPASGGAVISNCTVSRNSALRGAGIANGYNTGVFTPSAGNVTVVKTRITGNSRSANTCYGGGMWVNTSGTQLMAHCEVTANSFSVMYSAGGGLYIAKGIVDIRNCLVASNRCGPGAGCDGAGLYITTNATATVRACTIVGNETTRSYGGIYMLPTNNCGIWNCIIVSNRADISYADMFGGADYIAPVHYSCSPVLTNAAQGNLTNAPVFAEFAAGNYRLAFGSYGINAGTNESWMAGTVDLDGRSRLDRFSRRVDMGAYEFLPAATLFSGR